MKKLVVSNKVFKSKKQTLFFNKTLVTKILNKNKPYSFINNQLFI
jgi:hypothetical protein